MNLACLCLFVFSQKFVPHRRSPRTNGATNEILLLCRVLGSWRSVRAATIRLYLAVQRESHVVRGRAPSQRR